MASPTMTMKNPSLIAEAFRKAIEEKVFSGAQVILGKGAENLFSAEYGRHSWSPDAPEVARDSIFDVASLTKPVVTTTLTLMALKAGQIRLEDSPAKYLSTWDREEPIKLRHLLAHNSGLPDWEPLFQLSPSEDASREELQARFTEELSQISLKAPLGQKRIYSDLGFLILGFVLEKIFKNTLDREFQKRIAEPLEMKLSLFNPLNKFKVSQIVATEKCPWRKKLLHGEVHDDNAYVLGGVAGNAGLFSTASDLERFIHWCWDIDSGKVEEISTGIWREFLGEGVYPKLGWDTVSLPTSQAGQYFSGESFGHLAFTGCSMWMDPQDQKYIILLTNRVHPYRDNDAIKEFRPIIHNLLVQEFL